jgi:5-methylcytosine-specific restriction enzyme subunit McrC
MEDCPLNQALLGGMHLASDVAVSPDLKVALRRLAGALGVRVRARPLNRQLVARAQQSLDRMAAAYAPALELITLLLDGEAPALEDDPPALRIQGFLLDMNRLFQRLLRRFLEESLEGCRVLEERQIRDLLRYSPGDNPRRRQAPRPRPDFMVTTGDGKVTLLDAKYRDLWRRDLPRDMLYQLAIYALSQPRGGQATALYPTTASEARAERIEIREPLGGWERASVVLQPVDLGALDRAIAAGHSAAAERRALARALVFPGRAGDA